MKKVAKEIDSQFDSGRRNMDVDEVFKNAGVSNKFNSAYRDNIKGYIKELNEMSKSAPRAKTGIDGVNEALEKQGSTPVKTATNVLESISSGMASIGKTALSIGGNVALSYGLQKAGEAWDNYSNKQENAIEKGNEAISNYKQTNSTMQEATSWIKDNAERYTELAKGATSLGEQGSLTDAEFKEYNELSAQMATYLPSQIKGYNSLGTAILNVGNSTTSLNEALSSEKSTQYGEIAANAEDVIKKVRAEMYQNAGITKETGITNQKSAIESFLDDYDRGWVKEDSDLSKFGNILSYLGSGRISNEYNQNGNLTTAMEKAGIKKTGKFGLEYSSSDFTNKDNIETLRNYIQQLLHIQCLIEEILLMLLECLDHGIRLKLQMLTQVILIKQRLQHLIN